MDIEKISGTKGPKPAEKKQRTSTPDSEEFRQMMKTGKVTETEFEKPKKRPKQKKTGLERKEQEKPPLSKQAQPPSFYEGYATPSVHEYIEEPQQQPEPQQIQKEKREKKIKKKKKEKEKELATYQEKLIKESPKLPKKEEAKISIVTPKTTSKAKTFSVETKQPFVEKSIKATQEEKKPKKEKEKEKPQIQQSSVIEEMPPNIATQTQAITAPLTPYLHPDIVPLFEKMVGTIIQLQAKGITTTEVILNSPAFQSSIFYGSSVVVQKYSTAPAFNIFLRGPTQAVNMFSENLDGLFDAFKKANINIGRLEAEHEKFTFRRKEKPSSKKEKER